MHQHSKGWKFKVTIFRKKVWLKIRIADPFYEVPAAKLKGQDGLHPWDDDTLTVEQKKALLPKITKKKWVVTSSKYLLFNGIYVAEYNRWGDHGYYRMDIDLGVVENPVIKQLKTYTETLYDKFLAVA